VTPTPDPRLDEMFVRYWDNTLAPAEAEELERRLAADPVAAEWFRLFVAQAVAAADLPAPVPVPADATPDPMPAAPLLPPADPAAPGRGWTRRRALQFLGSGLAAGVGGVALGRWLWPDEPPVAPDRSIRLGAVHGNVTVRAADGRALPADGPLPPGSTVTATGPGTSAVLFYPNGTNVALTEDSELTLGGDGNRLELGRGVVTADIRSPLVGGTGLTLATAQAVLPDLSEVLMTLYHAPTSTEVGVQRGLVNVSAPTGRPLGEVRGGELFTVRSDGDFRKQPIPDTPEAFAWDLTRPLPDGWPVGVRDAPPGSPAVVRPELWFDPYHQKEMYQIRSDKQWTRGSFRLFPDSLVRVRYWVDAPGPGQVCFCVRTPDVRSPETGMLEWNGTYGADGVKAWRTLEVRAGEMLKNKHTPKFPHPWIGFLVIFNTYEANLGLKVAEFEVVPPPGAG
jgi:hypothetical protein